ncbi:MAG: pentapeptide repeat-containing protein, partial [Cyanobacteria bacterium P01_A01_bin.83]
MAKALQTLLITLGLILCFTTPVLADIVTEPRSDLTLEELQSQTSNLIQQDGRATLNLSNYRLDLSHSDREFNQQFYQEINDVIIRASNAININFDNSLILGDFDLYRLGIASSIGEGVISSLFTKAEKAQIKQYLTVDDANNQLIPQINVFRGTLYFNNAIFTGKVDGHDSIFLRTVDAVDAIFQDDANFNQAVFVREINFNHATFQRNANFSASHFWGQVNFPQSQFKELVDFSQSQFEALGVFNKVFFNQSANFSRSVFSQIVDFSQAIFSDRLIFAKSQFLDSVILTNSNLDQTVTFRDIYLNSLLDLKDAHILNRLDFSNAFFTPQSQINVSGLAFDGTEAKIIGQPGVIGKLLQVYRLQGNETVLHNLIRNFRSLEQIADANYIEYQQQQLKLTQINNRLFKTSWRKIFTWSWISLIPQWMSLSILLLLGDYGTNISLLFSLGIISTAFFSLLFWIIDRYRPHISQPIIPTRWEIIFMLLSYVSLTITSIFNIFITSNKPWLTLITIAVVLIPIPSLITSQIYQQGRYHQLLDQSYLVENGAFREF